MILAKRTTQIKIEQGYVQNTQVLYKWNTNEVYMKVHIPTLPNTKLTPTSDGTNNFLRNVKHNNKYNNIQN